MQNRVGALIEHPGVYPNMNGKENIKLKGGRVSLRLTKV